MALAGNGPRAHTRGVRCIGVGAGLWAAVALSSPPFDGGVTAPTTLGWAIASHELSWASPRCPATTRVTSVAVLRSEPLSYRASVSQARPLTVNEVDEFVVAFTHTSSDELCREMTRPRLEPGPGDVSLRRDSSSGGALSMVQGAVAVGTRTIRIDTRGSGTLEVNLETGDLVLSGAEGEQQRSPGSFVTPTVQDPPRYLRIPVDERFPGATMTQAGLFKGGCDRYFDLGVDAVYLVRGVPAPHWWVVDELVLDATFYRRVVGSGPDCQRHVSQTSQYASVLLADGRTIPGSEPDSRITIFGSRQLRRFSLPAGLDSVRLSLGGDNLLEVDLRRALTRVLSREATPVLPANTVVVDLSSEWEDRKAERSLYELRKLERGIKMKTRLDPRDDSFANTVCGELERATGAAYVPRREAEVMWEARALLCSPADAGLTTP